MARVAIKTTDSGQEDQSLELLDAALSQASGPIRIATRDQGEIALPEPVAQMLRKVVHILASGGDVSLIPVNRELSTNQAADLLDVSRPHLIKLIEEGKIPCHMVGSHRRVRLKDLMAYKRERDAERREILSQITQFSQDAGFYE